MTETIKGVLVVGTLNDDNSADACAAMDLDLEPLDVRRLDFEGEGVGVKLAAARAGECSDGRGFEFVATWRDRGEAKLAFVVCSREAARNNR